jgi:hypothetical protein
MACASRSAVAGDKEDAKQLFESGLKLMRVDDFASASATFERSIALYPTQNSLFNLANCYRAMQRYGEALATIELLKRDFADKLKPEIKEAVERQLLEIQSLVANLTLEMVPPDTSVKIDGKEVGIGPKLGPLLLEPGGHDLEASRPGHRSQRRTLKLEPGVARTEKFVLEVETGTLEVRANLEGASVFMDGQQIGTTPLPEPVSLTVGKHVLALRAAEREDFDRTIEIRADERQILDIVLSAKPAILLAPQPPPPAKTPEISLVTTETSPPKSRTLRIVTWSSLAAAVAAGAVASVYLVILNSQHNDFQKYNDLYAQFGRAQDDTKRRSLSDDMTRSNRITIGCGIGAGALAVTAVITYLVDSRSKPGESSVALSPAGIGVRF